MTLPRNWEPIVDVIAPALDRYIAPPKFITGLGRALLGVLQEAEYEGWPTPSVRVVESPGKLEIYVDGEFLGGYIAHAQPQQSNVETVPR